MQVETSILRDKCSVNRTGVERFFTQQVQGLVGIIIQRAGLNKRAATSLEPYCLQC